MGLSVTSIDDIPQSVVDEMFAQASQMMREKHPEIQLARGPFSDLVLYFCSIFAAGHQINIDRLRRSMSLKAIGEDPALADADTVDDVLSNYGITRLDGATATGEMTIVVSADVSTVIPSGHVFIGNGVEFATTDAYVGRPSTLSVVVDTERLLQPLGDGTFGFTIPVVALTQGADGNIRRGTKLVPNSTPPYFVRAFAAVDFSGGEAAETTEKLLQRLQEGIAAKSMGGSVNWVALLKAQPTFERTLAYSIRGFGDPEQMRDQHSILPISMGGRVDIYSRTNELPTAVDMSVTATLVDIVAGGSIWQFSIDASDAPGFYNVSRVALPSDAPDSPGYEVVDDIRGFDMEFGGRLPDIQTIEEAAYSRYQTAVIRFLDTTTRTVGLIIGATKTYHASILRMPLIAELQDFCSSRLYGCRPSDTLVKAAVPCFLSVSFDVRKDATEPSPDLAAIRNEVASTVNQIGFTGQLSASTIADAAHRHLTGRQALGRIEMFGRIRRPNGTFKQISSTSVLMIPSEPAAMVTGDTTAFILDPNDVAVSVVAAGFANG